jgi:thioredoxin 1
MTATYASNPPTRSVIDRTPGPLLLEFGADWCGICQAAQPNIARALREYPELRHIKVADGPGQPLGRSFAIKLWPTLILLRDGKEVARVVRPTSTEAISSLLRTLETSQPSISPRPQAARSGD